MELSFLNTYCCVKTNCSVIFDLRTIWTTFHPARRLGSALLPRSVKGHEPSPRSMIARVRQGWVEEVRRMSAIGTERLCRPVAKYFRCWRSTGRACGGAGPSQFDPKLPSSLIRRAGVDSLSATPLFIFWVVSVCGGRRSAIEISETGIGFLVRDFGAPSAARAADPGRMRPLSIRL